MLTDTTFILIEKPDITGLQHYDDLKKLYLTFKPEELDLMLYKEMRLYFKRVFLDSGEICYAISVKPLYNPPERIYKESEEIGNRINEKGYHRVENLIEEKKAIFIYSDGSEHFLERVRDRNIGGFTSMVDFVKAEKEEKRKIRRKNLEDTNGRDKEKHDIDRAERIRGYENTIITGSALDILSMEKTRREGLKKSSKNRQDFLRRERGC